MSAAAISMLTQPEVLEALEKRQAGMQKVAFVVLGVAATGVSFLLARRLIQNLVANKEAQGGMDKTAAASFAKRIHLAFENDDWFGTNEVRLRAILSEIPSWKFYQEVAKSYRKQYRSVLENDLEGELQTTEYEEMLEIIARLRIPEGNLDEHVKSWNERLRSAWDVSCWIFSCTDEDAAYAVLKEIKKMPDPYLALRRLEAYYKQANGKELQTEAQQEMEGEDLAIWNSHRNDILKTQKA